MGGQKTPKQALRLLRMLDNDQPPTSPENDPVLVSIDLEVSRGERAAISRSQSHIPYVKELGIAILDVRDIFAPLTPKLSELASVIATTQYSAEHSSEEFEDCDLTDFQECVFARTTRIRQADIVATIERYLQIPESNAILTPQRLRPIVLVGHSIKHDLNILRRLGLDIATSYPDIKVLDTHSLSRHILTPGGFTLGEVLRRLNCPHEASELHNAGNDATYTLHAVLLLAVKWARQQQMTQAQSDHQEIISAFVLREMVAPRWKPVRRALGAHAGKS